MQPLSEKHVLVGITGGIAAYKTPDLVRGLVEDDSIVKVVMTSSASNFISPLTMQAVSGEPVFQELLSSESETIMSHIELARWADQIIVAPATANFVAKLAAGLADDLLSTICLASEAPIAIAPAMNRVMWENSATRKNISPLEARGITVIGPDHGKQACGEVGMGRMIEPTSLINFFKKESDSASLSKLTTVVTAGPTWEALDPVRGFTNSSSGKMGYAIAKAALLAGSKVILISGPTTLSPPSKATTYYVTTAEEMLDQVKKVINDADIFIGVAAVSDYRPKIFQEEKIKRKTDSIKLELVPNTDILEFVASQPIPLFTVGFAAETTNPTANARKKLIKKNIDLNVANHVSKTNSPFGSDYNAITVVDRHSEVDLGAGLKSLLAKRLIKKIASKFHEKYTTTHS